DGMNNHDWPRNTRILKAILEKSDRFSVDVSTSPPTTQPTEAWDNWRPKFSDYACVVMNFNGGYKPETGVHWPRELEKSVEDYGKGRVYVTMLGHLWKDGPDTALRCVGFQTLFIRGVEWAATGNVTYPIPDDFPSADGIKMRPSTEPN